MEPVFLDDYEKREWLGREALKELQKLNPDFFKYHIQFNPERYGDYDAFYFIYDINGKFKKHCWIEIKVRNKTWPEYFLEKEKFDRLERLRNSLYLNKEEVVYLYLNFCPEGTYCWNVSNIDDGIWEERLMNKSTSNNRIDKELKKVKLLNTDRAKSFDYVLNEVQLLREWKLNYLLPKIEKKLTSAEKTYNFLFRD
jgi:hypothetical protein